MHLWGPGDSVTRLARHSRRTLEGELGGFDWRRETKLEHGVVSSRLRVLAFLFILIPTPRGDPPGRNDEVTNPRGIKYERLLYI